MRKYYILLFLLIIIGSIVEIGSYLKPAMIVHETLTNMAAANSIMPLAGKKILIDAGHQGKGNLEKEPIAPGSTVMKTKVTYGTTGVATGIPEYVFTLEMGLKLKESFAAMGAEVFMIREDHDVNISNKERALIGNDLNVDLVIKIHADGAADEKIRGISILYPSQHNKHTEKIAGKSRLAATYILDGLIANTQAENRGIKARADITGFNWSVVPVVLIECGYMSNPQEDDLLSDPTYQARLVKGILKGTIEYFTNQ
ncbi:N-acetylmuramoyl-L-alanine amidase family protein [Geosporobacter ferrireducens]|nr:N-acetylmuramoyl-L-alanine amidase [Geosporobacter ferrireducens]